MIQKSSRQTEQNSKHNRTKLTSRDRARVTSRGNRVRLRYSETSHASKQSKQNKESKESKEEKRVRELEDALRRVMDRNEELQKENKEERKTLTCEKLIRNRNSIRIHELEQRLKEAQVYMKALENENIIRSLNTGF